MAFVAIPLLSLCLEASAQMQRHTRRLETNMEAASGRALSMLLAGVQDPAATLLLRAPQATWLSSTNNLSQWQMTPPQATWLWTGI